MTGDTIVQWNCRGFKANFYELKILCERLNPLAFCLQETFLRQTDIYHFKHYDMYNCFGPGANRAAGGTAILVRQGIIHSHIQLDTPSQATAARITLSKTITLCSIYIPPSSAISLHDMDDLVRQLPTPYMLLGDFNSHNPVWGGNTIDGKGQRVEQFMDNHSLCFLNDGSYTYLHPGYGTYTAIDLTITQPNLLLDFSWRVLDDLCGSDHFPIIIKHQGPATGGREPGWRLKKADWHSFRALCDERLTADIHNSPEAIASFTDTLLSIADETVPKSSATPKHIVNPWLDADCEKAIKDRKKAERKFNRQPTAENLTTFKIKRAKKRGGSAGDSSSPPSITALPSVKSGD